jgi:hypothetical protein
VPVAQLERGRSIGGIQRDIARFFEHLPHQHADRRFVVDDEHGFAMAGVNLIAAWEKG